MHHYDHPSVFHRQDCRTSRPAGFQAVEGRRGRYDEYRHAYHGFAQTWTFNLASMEGEADQHSETNPAMSWVKPCLHLIGAFQPRTCIMSVLCNAGHASSSAGYASCLEILLHPTIARATQHALLASPCSSAVRVHARKGSWNAPLEPL